MKYRENAAIWPYGSPMCSKLQPAKTRRKRNRKTGRESSQPDLLGIDGN
jgi:hypothetical protein